MTSPETSSPGPLDRLWGLAQLVRLPNLFTAMADVTMGLLFVAGFQREDVAKLGLLLAASTLLYAAGTVLNDVFDFRLDQQERPERPLPSGLISLSAARLLGAVLLILGAVAAWSISLMLYRSGTGAAYALRPGIVGLLLAGCIVLYDSWLKRTPLGPWGMGACRLLNVLLGMSAAAEPWTGPNWIVAAAIGLYIAGVTWLARSEAATSRRGHLAAALCVMLAGIGLLAFLALWPDQLGGPVPIGTDKWFLFLAMLGGLIAWRPLAAIADPRPAVVQMAVAQSILSLVILDAAACFAARGMGDALIVLVFLLPTMALMQWVRAT